MTGSLFFAAPGTCPEPQACRPGQDAARSTRLLQQRSLCNGPGHRPSPPKQRLQSINTCLTPLLICPSPDPEPWQGFRICLPESFSILSIIFFLIFLCSVSGFVCNPQHLDTFYTPGKIIRVKNKQAGMQGKSRTLPQKPFPIKFQAVKKHQSQWHTPCSIEFTTISADQNLITN